MLPAKNDGLPRPEKGSLVSEFTTLAPGYVLVGANTLVVLKQE